MKNKYFSKSFLIISFSLIICFFITGCEKEFAINDMSEAKKLLNSIYPKKIECDYDLVTRYESKEEPISWVGFKWKKDNNYLEKRGLIKQLVIDTTIDIYERSNARFVQKHQYLYKIIMSDKLKSYISESQLRIKKFDEYDFDNRKTALKSWLSCKVVYGLFTVDTILKIDQKDPPYVSMIRYCEKFIPTAFNNIVMNAQKFYKDEILLQSIEAKKYTGEECRLVY